MSLRVKMGEGARKLFSLLATSVFLYTSGSRELKIESSCNTEGS